LKVPVHGATLSRAEDEALQAVINRRWFTEGVACAEFSRKLRQFTGARDVTLTNSGSSANLIALSTLAQRELGERAILPGDEVITTALCFPTTVAPIVQIGAIPVFIDVELPGLIPNVASVEDAITERTRAIVLTHTLGNPLPMPELRALADKYNLWLVEDCCDALGSPDTIEYSDLATLSFFPAHHITTGEGGAVLTRSPKLGKIARSLRDWGKDCWCAPGTDNTCGRRFADNRDHKYTFSRIGYNLKMTDFGGALGSAQMDKLPGFVADRAYNHARLNQLMCDFGLDDYFILPPLNYASWFYYALICKSGIDRNAIVAHLEKRGVQTRRVMAGNILKQPGYAEIEHVVSGTLVNTNTVDNRAFCVGCWPGLSEDHLQWIVYSIVEYVGGR